MFLLINIIIAGVVLADSPTVRLPPVTSRFIQPNETEPHKLSPFLKDAPKGLIFGVGTTRVLFDAMMAPHTTGIVQINLSAGPFWHNKIEHRLLRIATDREDYKWLRQQAPQKDWSARTGFPAEVYQWWLETIRVDQWNEDLFPQGFSRFNYVDKDHLFERVTSLSLDNHFADLKTFDFSTLTEQIAVLDISNAWMEQYFLKPKELIEILKRIEPFLAPNALIVYTTLPVLGRVIGPAYSSFMKWGYHVVSKDFIYSDIESVPVMLKRQEKRDNFTYFRSTKNFGTTCEGVLSRSPMLSPGH